MSDDLVTFLRARIDEDEKAAADARDDVEWWWQDPAQDSPAELHIARHSPERVLREVEAARELIAAYEEACERDPDGTDTDYASGLYVAVKLRAVAHGWIDA